jgi:photosystem II stability/assembly factor-like uncharacterized protein
MKRFTLSATVSMAVLFLLWTDGNPCGLERLQKSRLYRVLQKTGWLDEGWGFPVSVEGINSVNSECKPSLTADGKYIYFQSAAQNGPPLSPDHVGTRFNIYVARWNGSAWDSVTNLGPNVNPSSYSCISPDNRRIYLSISSKIFVSERTPTGWKQATKLPYPVNDTDQRVTDRSPSLSHDGNEMVFASNRSGGYGSYDLYSVKWNGSDWDSLTNLGPRINTPASETHPTLSPDMTKLYFSNFNGSGPELYFGDTDLFVSIRDAEGWPAGQLVGPPVNTDLPCCSAFPTEDGRLFLGSEVSEGGQGEEDIWIVYPEGVEIQRQRITIPGEGGWNNTAELRGAWYVHCLIEDRNGNLYAGTAPEGVVYKSEDKGGTWNRTGVLQGALRVYSLMEAADGTVYAGTYPNGDVFKTNDGGAGWDNTPDLRGATAVRALIQLPDGRIVAGTSPDSADVGRLFIAPNGGTAWTLKRTPPEFAGGVFALLYARDVLFATGRIRGDKVLFSRNFGNSWSVIDLPWENDDITLSAFYFLRQTEDGKIWTGGWAHGPQGVMGYSEDNGQHWTPVSEIRRPGSEMARLFDCLLLGEDRFLIAGHPGPDSVLAATDDAGVTWTWPGTLPGAYEALCLLKAKDGSIYAGTTPNGDVFKLGSATSVEENLGNPGRPGTFGLSQNYPNPFNSSTYLHYWLDAPADVSLEIFSVTGGRVRVLTDGRRNPGDSIVFWDGCNDHRGPVASGIYAARLTVRFENGTVRQARVKMMVMK